MSALLKTLTFNALQQKSIPSTYCADHELFHHVVSKWDTREDCTFSAIGICSGINNCVYLKTSKDGSSPDQLVFDGSANGQVGMAVWTHPQGHRQFLFGFTDFKGGVALWVRMQEAYLSSYVRKNGDHESVWRVMSGLKEQQSKEVVEEPYSDTLPQELVDRLSAPETGDPGLLEELIKFVEDNRVFKEDMLALLNYLASDQCVHGYCNLVAGYEA